MEQRQLTITAGAISSVSLVTGADEDTISVRTVSIRVTVIIHTALINIYNSNSRVLCIGLMYSHCHPYIGGRAVGAITASTY